MTYKEPEIGAHLVFVGKCTPATRGRAGTIFRHRGTCLRLANFNDNEFREIACAFAQAVDEAKALAKRQGLELDTYSKQLRMISPIVADFYSTSDERRDGALAIIRRARQWIRGASLENTPFGVYLTKRVHEPRDIDAAIQTNAALGVATTTRRARGGVPGLPVVVPVRWGTEARLRPATRLGEETPDDRDLRRARANRPRGHVSRRNRG